MNVNCCFDEISDTTKMLLTAFTALVSAFTSGALNLETAMAHRTQGSNFGDNAGRQGCTDGHGVTWQTAALSIYLLFAR